jgi:hypothetical protein
MMNRGAQQPGEMWRWFTHGTSMALKIAQFCNILLQKTNKKTQKGTNHTTVFIPTESLHLFAKCLFGGQTLNLFWL